MGSLIISGSSILHRRRIRRKKANIWKFIKAYSSKEDLIDITTGFKWYYKEKASANYYKINVKSLVNENRRFCYQYLFYQPFYY